MHLRNRSISRRFSMLIAAGAVIIAGCADDTAGKFGQELFEQTCAVCHGADASGTPGRPAIGAGSNAVQLSDEQIRGVMEVGPGVMPSFRRLTSDQIDSLIEYLRILQSGQAKD